MRASTSVSQWELGVGIGEVFRIAGTNATQLVSQRDIIALQEALPHVCPQLMLGVGVPVMGKGWLMAEVLTEAAGGWAVLATVAPETVVQATEVLETMRFLQHRRKACSLQR